MCVFVREREKETETERQRQRDRLCFNGGDPEKVTQSFLQVLQ